MVTQLFLVTLFQALAPTAAESNEVVPVEIPDNTPAVFAPSAAQWANCKGSGVVCVAPGGSATMIGTEIVADGPFLTVLARGTQVAAKGALAKASADQPWQVEMVAKFRGRSAEAPLVVVVFDTADANSIARKEAQVLWTVNQEPSRELGMRFLLSPEDGFEPSHTYLVRVVQNAGNSDRILAEGLVHLE